MLLKQTWFKALALVFTLFLLVLILQVSVPGGLTGVLRKLGLLTSPWSGPHSLVWCPTRVVEVVEIPSQKRLVQEKREWISYRPERVAINFVDAEKWFAEHCDLAVEELAAAANMPLPRSPVLQLRFVDGSEGTLNQLGQDIFEWQGRYFRSQQLSAAVAAMKLLINSGGSSSCNSSKVQESKLGGICTSP